MKLGAKLKSNHMKNNNQSADGGLLYDQRQQYLRDRFKIPSGKLATEPRTSPVADVPKNANSESAYEQLRREELQQKFKIKDGGLEFEGLLGARLQQGHNETTVEDAVIKFDSEMNKGFKIATATTEWDKGDGKGKRPLRLWFSIRK
jgi:hypothetical protein